MKRIQYFFIIYFALNAVCIGQNSAAPYLFGRNPYAAAEAMGGANTALGTNLFSVFYNPAGIQNMNGIEVAGSFANQYYSSDAKYIYGSAGMRWNKYLSTAITYHEASYSIASIYMVGTNRPPLQKFTFTVASAPFKNFNVGLNLNRFEYNELYKTSAYCVDAGLQYKIELNKKSMIFIGSEMKNLNGAVIKYNFPGFYPSPEVNIPTIGSTGIAYQNKKLFKSERLLVGLTLQLEYCYNLKHSNYNTPRFGTELQLWNQLNLRGGVGIDPFPGSDGNKNPAISYGLGWNIIMDNYDYFKGSRNEWQLDVCSLQQRPYEYPTSSYYSNYIVASILFKHRLTYKKDLCLTCP